MKLNEEIFRIRELLGEDKQEKGVKYIKIPSIAFESSDGAKDKKFWPILQNIFGQLDDVRYTVDGSLFLRNSDINSIGNLYSVQSVLDLGQNPIESLGVLKFVGRDLRLDGTNVSSLGDLEMVGNDLYAFSSSLESLGNLKSVGNDLWLKNTPIAEKYTEDQIREMVDVNGNIYM